MRKVWSSKWWIGLRVLYETDEDEGCEPDQLLSPFIILLNYLKQRLLHSYNTGDMLAHSTRPALRKVSLLQQ